MGGIGAAAGEGEAALPGKVLRKIFLGDIVEIDVDTPVGPLTVQRSTADGGWQLGRVGEAVSLHWRVADSLVFPSEAPQ
jgi:hypothetical protein